jgi:hypothetical protein
MPKAEVITRFLLIFKQDDQCPFLRINVGMSMSSIFEDSGVGEINYSDGFIDGMSQTCNGKKNEMRGFGKS